MASLPHRQTPRLSCDGKRYCHTARVPYAKTLFLPLKDSTCIVILSSRYLYRVTFNAICVLQLTGPEARLCALV